jgi:hypothetical protein
MDGFKMTQYSQSSRDAPQRHFYRYLDAKQHIWNAYFIDEVQSLYETEPLRSFEQIDALLFHSLVALPLQLKLDKDFSFRRSPVPSLVLKPVAQLSSLNVQVLEPAAIGTGKWTRQELIGLKSARFAFIEFFQWDQYGYWSTNEIRCLVVKYADRPDLVGGQVQFPALHLDFVLTKRR